MRPAGAAPVVLLVSGPNLQLLGERQPLVYGTETLADHVARARTVAEAHGLLLEHRQSDHEGDLVAAVLEARATAAAIVINGGALSHYGWSLRDALACFDGVIVELHLTNPAARESWRRTSVFSAVVDGAVAGFGGLGYELAIEGAARLLEARGAVGPGA